MLFPFTFIFNAPGLPNPFNGPQESSSVTSGSRPLAPDSLHSQDVPAPPYIHNQALLQAGYSPNTLRRTSRADLPKINRPRPSSSPSPAPTSRKRGWEPTFAEPSRSTTTLASGSGYLDTPAKYREMAMSGEWNGYQDMNDQQDRQEDEEGELCYPRLFWLCPCLDRTIIELWYCSSQHITWIMSLLVGAFTTSKDLISQGTFTLGEIVIIQLRIASCMS